MQDEAFQLRDRRWAVLRGLSNGVYAGAVGFLVAYAALGAGRVDGIGWQFWLSVGTSGLIITLFVWRYAQAALLFDGRRLTIRNPFRVHRYDLGEVVSLVPERLRNTMTRRAYLAAAVREPDRVRRRKIVALTYDSVTYGVLPEPLLKLSGGPDLP